MKKTECCDNLWPDIMDAKLTTKQRKRLKSGTFCGPGRSFPVPDCAHVTAAKRLIGRAKVSSSTKAKILACVNRKAKSLGCKTSDNTEKIDELIESEVFDNTREVIFFLESLDEDMSNDLKSSEAIKEKATDILIMMRQWRFLYTQKNFDDIKSELMTRSLASIFDAIQDEFTYIQSEKESNNV